jgi:hypothetical protein
VQQSNGVTVNYHTLYSIVHTRFKAKLNVPRPSYTKNPAAISEFRAACQERLQPVAPPGNIRPSRTFSQHEIRLGILTFRRRRLMAHGVEPIGAVQHVFEWL